MKINLDTTKGIPTPSKGDIIVANTTMGGCTYYLIVENKCARVPNFGVVNLVSNNIMPYTAHSVESLLQKLENDLKGIRIVDVIKSDQFELRRV